MGSYNTSEDNSAISVYDFIISSEDSAYSTVKIILCVVFSLITVSGIVLNFVVIYVLVRHGQIHVTNCFLINLAVTDFAFLLVTAPFTASYYARTSWIFGDKPCKIVMYIIHVTLHATCLTLTAMTVDRYTSIVHVFRSRRWRTTKFAVKVCAAVWIVSFLLPIPFAIYYRQVTNVVTNRHHCLLMWPDPAELYNKVAVIAIACTTYFLPLAVIIFCYSRILLVIYHRNDSYPLDDSDKRTEVNSPPTSRSGPPRWRTTKLVILLVVVFAVLWFPVHFLVIWMTMNTDIPKTFTIYLVKGIARSLSYSNSCVNPFLYVFMSKGFRQALKRAFPDCLSTRGSSIDRARKTLRQNGDDKEARQLTSD